MKFILDFDDQKLIKDCFLDFFLIIFPGFQTFLFHFNNIVNKM
jgi:hypothetical protein